MTRCRALGGLAFLIAALLHPAASRADELEVDLALVLAVDVSRSMDNEEQVLQREGYVEAFRSEVVHNAIRNGMVGRIAVTYMEWSGPGQQAVVMPWTVIDDASGSRAFADRLGKAPIGRIFSTSISGAIDFGVALFRQSNVTALRRVIDVSGDGPNNTGRIVTLARDEAIAQGIVINGLPFMVKQPTGFGDVENLDHYYEDCVIGGPGAFSIPIRDKTQIGEATRNKIVREIADLGPEPRIVPAQGRPAANCLMGEQQRRMQYGP
ncbi:DUF1194 domain-containing protein [uncultured Alsobacter sp.]|uniref:DUF1194 domain-containing protein n=1 Tax=uncultured Alsobacter sp. TaxID=1748258 RepID=UPI0025FF6742|nr:DUF1194 domain-containing protein [uncultured Alsobacter sp.]